MELLRAVSALLLSLALFLVPSTAGVLNITNILEKYPEFSSFNQYLTQTKLAAEINSRQTITICAVDNAGMAGLVSKHLGVGSIKNVLALHVLLDYFDAQKLHQISNGTALVATVFQATGSAPGNAGFVKIDLLKGGKVGFTPANNGGPVGATFVKTVQAVPYNFSIIQISNALPSQEAEAPAPPPPQINLTDAMSAHCNIFAQTLLASPAEQTFESNIASGLTIFCPSDDAMKKFVPKFKNLTADDKQSLLEYHGMPIYESLSGLRSNNGATNTLATDGAKQFSFTVQNDADDVTIHTPIVTAKIVSTVMDKSPVAIFQLDKVLMPNEIFKSSLPPSSAPAPAPAPGAKAPAPSRTDKSPPAPDVPADSPDDADAPAADTPVHKKRNGAVRFSGARLGGVILSVWFAFLHS